MRTIVGVATTVCSGNAGTAPPVAETPSVSPGAKIVPGDAYTYVPALSGATDDPFAPNTPPVIVSDPADGAGITLASP